ncbi:uncharacterized protein TNCV_2686131 [Trichonephila clavipes]|nr:uncharacterized protein TNCV_2686131 [Trichonephila clavipes]
MTPHTIPPAVGAVCRCKANAGLRRSPRGLYTRTRLSSLLRLNLDYRESLKRTWFHSSAVQFPRAWHHSKWSCRWVGVKGSTRKEFRDPKCPSAKRLRMVREVSLALVKVLPVPVWSSIKQLATHAHFLRCGGLFVGWSVKDVLSLVFV